MTGKCVYFTMVILRLMILSLHLNYALPQSRIDTEAELPKTDKNTKSPFGVQSINRVSNVKIGKLILSLYVHVLLVYYSLCFLKRLLIHFIIKIYGVIFYLTLPITIFNTTLQPPIKLLAALINYLVIFY